MEGGRGVEKRGWRGRGSMEGRELVGGWECVEGGGMDGGNEFGGGGEGEGLRGVGSQNMVWECARYAN